MLERLQGLRYSMEGYRARKKWYRYLCHRSAVALILREHEQGLDVLMIKRAEREGDPWSGHMAFPGGRLDKTDRHGLAAAKRETWEEIGLSSEAYGHCFGRLSDISTRPHSGKRPMVISAYVFGIEMVPPLTLNHEVAEVIWIPVSFLADRANRDTMTWERGRLSLKLPCYFYQGQRIWGLSLMMLDELLAVIASNARE